MQEVTWRQKEVQAEEMFPEAEAEQSRRFPKLGEEKALPQAGAQVTGPQM